MRSARRCPPLLGGVGLVDQAHDLVRELSRPSAVARSEIEPEPFTEPA